MSHLRCTEGARDKSAWCDVPEADGPDLDSGGVDEDIEARMHRMDDMHKRRYCEWVKHEDNFYYVLRNLRTICACGAYDARTIARGIDCIIAEYSDTKAAQLLYKLGLDLPPSFMAGVLCELMVPWQSVQRTAEVLAAFVGGMDVESSASFVQIATRGWDALVILRLVGILETRLAMSKSDFRLFLELFTAHLRDKIRRDQLETLRNLRAIYETRLAVAGLKLSVAKYNLAIANYNLTVANCSLSLAQGSISTSKAAPSGGACEGEGAEAD
eukprot:Opistho-2@13448